MDTNWKSLMKFALPVTLIGIADIALILIDLFWINFFIGEAEALSAIRLSTSVIILIEAVIIGVISAILIYVSQNYGGNKMDSVKRGVKTGLAFSFYAGLFVGAVGLLIHPLFQWIFGVDEQTIAYLNQYLIVLFIGYLFMSLNNFLLLIPRYFQKLRAIYWGLGIAIVANAAVTPGIMMLFNLYDLPLMAGAAVGTVVANILCFIFLLYKLYFKDYLNIQLEKRDISFRLDFKLLKENKEFIGSQLFTGITFNLSMFLYIVILSFYPNDAFNVYAVGTYIFILFGVFSQNFAASAIPLVSYSVGEGKIDNVKDIVKKMSSVLLVYSGTIAIAIILLRSVIALVFTKDATLLPRFEEFFLYYSIPWVLNTVSMIFIFAVSGSGDYKGGLYLTFTNMYVIVLLMLFFVPNLFGDVVTGVFITLSLINVITFVNTVGYYMIGRWKKASLVTEEQVLEGSA
ncbi:MATE family efflux transporter [Bacillus alkalisoli]|uniref:MATE family efflux transporter n=1 Tax=Bacillus alkalisoli TaxID=2011008 RepID=UPI000C237FB8|nr:MATE family efflux transporter [Bacillus alkalisoli]